VNDWVTKPLENVARCHMTVSINFISIQYLHW